jgi:hypothetical protein
MPGIVPELELDTVPEPARRADVTVQEIGGDTILTDPRARRTHVINASAAWVWMQLDGSTTVEDIARRLADRYDVDLSVARTDVERIAASFRSLGLLAG